MIIIVVVVVIIIIIIVRSLFSTYSVAYDGNNVNYLMKSENISTDMCEITSSGTLKTAKILRGIHLMRATGLFIYIQSVSKVRSDCKSYFAQSI